MSHRPNLTNWPKGVSGNPAGKPKGTLSMTGILRKAVSMIREKQNKDTGEIVAKPVYEWIADALIKKATKGEINAIKEVFERIDGKVTNTVDIGNKDEKPFAITHLTKEQIDAIVRIGNEYTDESA